MMDVMELQEPMEDNIDEQPATNSPESPQTHVVTEAPRPGIDEPQAAEQLDSDPVVTTETTVKRTYFFPELEKSVQATSMAEAQKLVENS
jgi:hypothetical protein